MLGRLTFCSSLASLKVLNLHKIIKSIETFVVPETSNYLTYLNKMAMAMANPEAVHPSAEQPNVLCKRCTESNATLQIRSESVCQFVMHLSILL